MGVFMDDFWKFVREVITGQTKICKVPNVFKSRSVTDAANGKISKIIESRSEKISNAAIANQTITLDCGVDYMLNEQTGLGIPGSTSYYDDPRYSLLKGEEWDMNGEPIAGTGCPAIGCCYDISQVADISMSVVNKSVYEEKTKMFNEIKQTVKTEIEATLAKTCQGGDPQQTFEQTTNKSENESIKNIQKELEKLINNNVSVDQNMTLSYPPLPCINPCGEKPTAGTLTQSLNIEIAAKNIVESVLNEMETNSIEQTTEKKTTFTNVDHGKLYTFALIFVLCFLVFYMILFLIAGFIPYGIGIVARKVSILGFQPLRHIVAIILLLIIIYIVFVIRCLINEFPNPFSMPRCPIPCQIPVLGETCVSDAWSFDCESITGDADLCPKIEKTGIFNKTFAEDVICSEYSLPFALFDHLFQVNTCKYGQKVHVAEAGTDGVIETNRSGNEGSTRVKQEIPNVSADAVINVVNENVLNLVQDHVQSSNTNVKSNQEIKSSVFLDFDDILSAIADDIMEEAQEIDLEAEPNGEPNAEPQLTLADLEFAQKVDDMDREKIIWPGTEYGGRHYTEGDDEDGQSIYGCPPKIKQSANIKVIEQQSIDTDIAYSIVNEIETGIKQTITEQGSGEASTDVISEQMSSMKNTLASDIQLSFKQFTSQKIAANQTINYQSFFNVCDIDGSPSTTISQEMDLSVFSQNIIKTTVGKVMENVNKSTMEVDIKVKRVGGGRVIVGSVVWNIVFTLLLLKIMGIIL